MVVACWLRTNSRICLAWMSAAIDVSRSTRGAGARHGQRRSCGRSRPGARWTASSPILIWSSLLTIGGSQIGEFDLGRVELALGERERDLVGLGIDVEQRIAGLDLLPLDDVDRDDRAGHLRRDQRLVGADIGVVGRDVAAAVQPPGEAERERDERHDDEQDETRPAALALDDDRRLGRRRRGGRRRLRAGAGVAPARTESAARAGRPASARGFARAGCGPALRRRERQRLGRCGEAGGSSSCAGSRAAAGLGWVTSIRLPQSIRS